MEGQEEGGRGEAEVRLGRDIRPPPKDTTCAEDGDHRAALLAAGLIPAALDDGRPCSCDGVKQSDCARARQQKKAGKTASRTTSRRAGGTGG